MKWGLVKLTDEQRRTGSHFSREFRDKIRRHEERHQRCAHAFGADTVWEYDSDGAWFQIIRNRQLTPVQFAAIYWAGGKDGCWRVDDALAWGWINTYQRGERKAREAEARELARRYR